MIEISLTFTLGNDENFPHINFNKSGKNGCSLVMMPLAKLGDGSCQKRPLEDMCVSANKNRYIIISISF